MMIVIPVSTLVACVGTIIGAIGSITTMCAGLISPTKTITIGKPKAARMSNTIVGKETEDGNSLPP